MSHATMTTPPAIDQYVERLAALVAEAGANVQPGQIVTLAAELGKEHLIRAITAACYRRGARFVEVSYADPHIKRARIQHADEATLDFHPSWLAHRMVQLGEQRCARIALSGPTQPHLFDDLDPNLVGKEQSVPRREALEVMNAQTTNWTIAPAPTPDWARLVFPDMPADEAYLLLWQQIAHVCRLDEDDPARAWRDRGEQLTTAAETLTERGFDALRFRGPGTDLKVGLLPTHRFLTGGGAATVDGVPHMPNVPSEEVFTSPDPVRVEGVVRSTRPLFVSGVIVEGLEMRFEAGRAVQVRADSNVDVMRSLVSRDEGAAMLGEVALVDGSGRIGPLGTVFFDTLLDENAASHIAVGRGFDFAVDPEYAGRVNQSDIHIDFMIGDDDVDVFGIDASGQEQPVLIGGAWRI